MAQNHLLSPRANARTVAPHLDTSRAAQPGRPLLIALFTVYLALLAWVVLWKLELPYAGAAGVRPVKLVPFVASGEFAANAPLEIGINLALFVPFGVYLGLLAPRWSPLQSMAVFAGTSLVLECIQFALAVGAFDTTDLIANTAGGVFGLAFIAIVTHDASARMIRRITRWCLAGTSIAVLLAGTFFASPMHFNRIDVVPGSHQPPR